MEYIRKQSKEKCIIAVSNSDVSIFGSMLRKDSIERRGGASKVIEI